MPQLMPLEWIMSFLFIMLIFLVMIFYYGESEISFKFLNFEIKFYKKWYW